MKSIDMQKVVSFYNHYHTLSKKKPNLYKSHEGGISVVLPEDMCWEWSNRAGGDSGGDNPRPIGIRYYRNYVEDVWGSQDLALKEIFSSVKNLKEFILESDCEGAEHLNDKIARKKSGIYTRTRSKAKANVVKAKVDFSDALAAARKALSGKKVTNTQFIRDSIESQLRWFTCAEDAGSLALEIAR